LRCQPMTVSGLTMSNEDCQSRQASHHQAHSGRSADVSFGRFMRAAEHGELVSKSEVFRLKGGPRFEGRERGDSQPMKSTQHQSEDSMKDVQTPWSHSVRSFRQAQSTAHNASCAAVLCSVVLPIRQDARQVGHGERWKKLTVVQGAPVRRADGLKAPASGHGAFPDGGRHPAIQAMMSVTTVPATSVRRKSRPLYRYVSRV
jgi:hypothetical protein